MKFFLPCVFTVLAAIVFLLRRAPTEDTVLWANKLFVSWRFWESDAAIRERCRDAHDSLVRQRTTDKPETLQEIDAKFKQAVQGKGTAQWSWSVYYNAPSNRAVFTISCTGETTLSILLDEVQCDEAIKGLTYSKRMIRTQ